jgi:hypothetical protein
MSFVKTQIMKLNYLTCILLTIICVIFYSCYKEPIDYSKEITDLKAEVTALKKKSDSLSIALNGTNTGLSNLGKSIDSIKSQLTTIITQINQLNAQITSVNANITTINAQIALLNQQYAALLAQLNAILAQLSISQSTLSNGLVAYYPFTGNAADSSGNGLNGTIDGASQTTDRFGKTNSAYSFDGNDKISTSSSSTLNLVGDFSISNWILLNQEGLSWFINKSPGGGPGIKWVTEIVSKNSKYTQPEGATIGFQVGTPTNYNFRAAADVQLNKWIHYSVVRAGNTITLYFNGVKVLENTTTVIFQNNTSVLHFGSDEAGKATENSLRGKLDDIRIYNRALTQQEITYLATH